MGRRLGGWVIVALAGLGLACPSALAAGETCFGKRPTISAAGSIEGTPGDDVIIGSEGADTIDGAGGADLICGLGGDDDIAGDDGDGKDKGDKIDGGEGEDYLDTGTQLVTAKPMAGIKSQTVDEGRKTCWGTAGD